MPLSERQQSTTSAAITILAVAVILAAAGGIVWLAAWFLQAFSSVLLPLATAAVAALVFQPFYGLLRRRLPTPAAIALLFLSVLVPLAAFGWFFGALVVEQVSGLVSRIPGWWQQAVDEAQRRWPQVVAFLHDNPFGQRLQQALEGQDQAVVQGLQFFGGKALSAGRGLLRGIFSLLNWVVAPIYFVFFLTTSGRTLGRGGELLPFLKPETRADVVGLIEEFVNILVAFFRGQLIIAMAQGLLFAAGFTLAGLQYGFVIGLALGFLNIIPYLGNLVGLGVALPLAYFQEGGGGATVAWVMIVFAAVQSIEAYILTPRIMGERTGLHPMAIIVAIFFWGSALGGILGMVMAIPLTAFLVVVWRLAREKYIREWV